jgi:MFS family permease
MNKTRILLTTSLVSSLIMLDSNIVAVSLPAIGRTFHASFTDIEWVISAYLLAFAALLLATGAFADLRGRKMTKDPDAKRLDWPGIATFSPALFLFIWALIDGNDAGWGSSAILGRMAGAVALALIFIVIEWRQHRPVVHASDRYYSIYFISRL